LDLEKEFDKYIMKLKKYFIKFIRFIQFLLDNFNAAFPNMSQNIQLTFIYFFAIVDLIYSILVNVFSLGDTPEILRSFLPIINIILSSSILKIFASPEKVFFMSYVVIELMLVRKVLKFSKLVKYNVLLIFSLLMVQGLVISYWDLLFHRAISTVIHKWAYDSNYIFGLNRTIAILLFFNTFLIFFLLYMYLYTRALKGIIATIPGLVWLTDSVAFWLRIKTPTMRTGRRRKKKSL
jgi:hypothetical protein